MRDVCPGPMEGGCGAHRRRTRGEHVVHHQQPGPWQRPGRFVAVPAIGRGPRPERADERELEGDRHRPRQLERVVHATAPSAPGRRRHPGHGIHGWRIIDASPSEHRAEWSPPGVCATDLRRDDRGGDGSPVVQSHDRRGDRCILRPAGVPGPPGDPAPRAGAGPRRPHPAPARLTPRDGPASSACQTAGRSEQGGRRVQERSEPRSMLERGAWRRGWRQHPSSRAAAGTDRWAGRRRAVDDHGWRPVGDHQPRP
jgi:hypothetical protein